MAPQLINEFTFLLTKWRPGSKSSPRSSKSGPVTRKDQIADYIHARYARRTQSKLTGTNQLFMTIQLFPHPQSDRKNGRTIPILHADFFFYKIGTATALDREPAFRKVPLLWCVSNIH